MISCSLRSDWVSEFGEHAGQAGVNDPAQLHLRKSCPEMRKPQHQIGITSL